MSTYQLILITGLVFLTGCQTFNRETNRSTTVQMVVRWPDSVRLPTTLGVRGSLPPLSWQESFLLTREPASGVFTGSIQVQTRYPLQSVQWKLMADEQTYELDGYTNRRLWLQSDSTIQLETTFNDPGHPDSLPISGSDWQRDVGLLQTSLEQFHPALYRYQDRPTFLRHLDSLRTATPRHQTEAYAVITRFLSQIRCSHTWANRYNQSVTLNRFWKETKPVLPFYSEWIDNSLVVTRSPDEKQLPVGSRIGSINGIRVDSLVRQLLPFTRADGTQPGKRFTQLSTGSAIQLMDLFAPLPASDSLVSLRILPPDSASRQISLPVLTINQRTAFFPENSTAPWSLRIDPDSNLAILTLNSFTVWNFGFDWKAKLDSFFVELRNRQVPELVIDIRQNEGGADEVIAELTRYIIRQPIRYKQNGTAVVHYEVVPDSLRPFLSTWEPSWYDRRGSLRPHPAGGYELIDRADHELVIEPASVRWDGRAYLLTSPVNSSATHHLAVLWNQFNLATLVGSETGGNLRGSAGGQFFFLHLPGSGLEVDIPLVTTINPEAGPDSGLKPNLSIRQTIGDFIRKRDTVIDYIRNQPTP